MSDDRVREVPDGPKENAAMSEARTVGAAQLVGVYGDIPETARVLFANAAAHRLVEAAVDERMSVELIQALANIWSAIRRRHRRGRRLACAGTGCIRRGLLRGAAARCLR